MKRKIFNLLTIILICVLFSFFTFTISAEETNYFEISFGENQEIRETLYFVDCGINEQERLWSNLLGYYNSYEIFDTHPSVFFMADDNLVVVLYEWSDSANNYLRQFHLRDSSDEMVTIHDQVIPGMHYRMEYFTFNEEECDHFYKERENDIECIYYCMYCGDEQFDHTHDYVKGEIISEVTCTVDGSYYDVCCVVGCGKQVIVVEPSTGHDITIVPVQLPTCTDKGINKHTCSNCDYETLFDIEPLGHTLIEFSCTEPQTCINCDYSIEAPGHVPSINAFGYTVCKVCNNIVEYEGNQGGSSENENGGFFENLFGNLNDGFSEFNTNLEQLLTLIAGFCMFILLFLGIKKIIQKINTKK